MVARARACAPFGRVLVAQRGREALVSRREGENYPSFPLSFTLCHCTGRCTGNHSQRGTINTCQRTSHPRRPFSIRTSTSTPGPLVY